ncbi:MAG: archease [Steroidobacteraceae bacterium]|jgi:tRNA nucleotidyltransferase (CCA-adding enzyme)
MTTTQAAQELFAHGADIGVRGRGRTLELAFANAARALTTVVTDPASVRAVTTVDVRCGAPDCEQLFVAWLNEIVYQMSTRRMLFARFDVEVTRDDAGPWRLCAQLAGEPVDVARHQPAVEVKGATFTALEVSEHDGEWVAGCVVDV